MTLTITREQWALASARNDQRVSRWRYRDARRARKRGDLEESIAWQEMAAEASRYGRCWLAIEDWLPEDHSSGYRTDERIVRE